LAAKDRPSFINIMISPTASRCQFCESQLSAEQFFRQILSCNWHRNLRLERECILACRTNKLAQKSWG
jgi:hypothetical protein